MREADAQLSRAQREADSAAKALSREMAEELVGILRSPGKLRREEGEGLPGNEGEYLSAVKDVLRGELLRHATKKG